MVLAPQALGKIHIIETALEQAVLSGLFLRPGGSLAPPPHRRFRRRRIKTRPAGRIGEPDRHFGTLGRLGSALDGQPLRRCHEREATLEDALEGIRLEQTRCRIHRDTAAVQLDVNLLVQP